MSTATMSSSASATANATRESPVSLRSWLAVLGAALGAFMAVLDIQIVNSSLQDIQGALGATLDEGTWIATSYLVAEIVTIPLTPWLSKAFSTRLYVIVNGCFFILFSMLCAWAPDLNGMIICRALQGFTGGILIPMAFTIILTSLPPSKRPIGMAIFAITATFAPSIGPAIGGWLTDTYGWQYIFYLNVLPGILFVTTLWLTLPKEPLNLKLLKDGDWLGIISMASGLGCLEVVLEEGNRKDWFGNNMIVTLAIISALSLIIFFWRELTAKKPLINLKLLAERNFSLASVANTTLGFGLYGSVYIVPVYLAQIQGYSALQIGTTMMWLGLPQLLIIPLVPKLMTRVDPRLLLSIGISLFATSCLMNTNMTFLNAGDQLIPSLLVRALGQPLIMVPLSTLATSGIEGSQASSASALFNMMRNLGGSIGVALISTFVTRREQFHSSRIGESIHQASLTMQEHLNGLTQQLVARGVDAVTAHDQAIKIIDNTVRRESFVMAYNDSFLIMGATLLLSIIAIAFLKKPRGPAAAGVH
ncbi:MAG: DHA2 family efflux MFS transporter permease subunit [Candidatus Melainabacteria bacterium]|nr:MAG: DHA2 family efflux MFS transporter permease subunit [Candidatus Melainabacteria bacterium]